MIPPSQLDQQQSTKMQNPPEAFAQWQYPTSVQFTHVCDICKKGFDSGQALGGHKSAHFRKGKGTIGERAEIDEAVEEFSGLMMLADMCQDIKYMTSSCWQVDSNEIEKIMGTSKRRKQLDESVEKGSTPAHSEVKNERQKLYETVPHQCKICNKIYPTGQALGGHQRLHYKGPTKQRPHSSARGLLEFDLNQIPSMEDEDGIYAPSVLLSLDIIS